MNTTIVYVLVSTEKDLYLEEMWASIHSLRRFHPEANIKTLVDRETATRIESFPQLSKEISYIVIVQLPEGYTPKQRSRQIKTTIRQIIEGPYLFIDTDTIICKELNFIDTLDCDIAAVYEGHAPISQCAFSPLQNINRIFGIDTSNLDYWYNSGVMYVADNERTHKLYNDWNQNWAYSCFQKGCSQDQPALLKANIDNNNIITSLPDIFNCQVAMSLKYFADAAIVHFWHMGFIENQSYSPFFSMEIYKEIRQERCITKQIENIIFNCKSSFVSPSMPVGIDQIHFLFSPVGQIFGKVYKEGGFLSYLMIKIANIFILIKKYHA